ncbi:hypothetical protein IscW_ISCW020657 [Ixodes scapularis]|uniref:Uncharacterized protein n=1 Tax=Ixodes scapularis TaxID=6945 RepID=B7Q2Q0_IXOSC|nr:hypothetical protein IscW_ISCW020657 [Ixodes scapularis]|eukprot:XP_002410930.1 hypothetical protein IscW_ISCW020657 [Ixodes scapularis]
MTSPTQRLCKSLNIPNTRPRRDSGSKDRYPAGPYPDLPHHEPCPACPPDRKLSDLPWHAKLFPCLIMSDSYEDRAREEKRKWREKRIKDDPCLYITLFALMVVVTIIFISYHSNHADSLRHVSSPSSARSIRGMSFRPPHPGDFGGPSFYAPQMYPYRPYYVPPGLAPVANLGYTGGSPMTYNFQPFPPRRSASLPRPPPSVDDQQLVRKPSKPRKPHKSLKLPCGRKVDITKKNLYIK